MNIFYDRDEWEEESSDLIEQSSKEDKPKTFVIPQVEINLKIYDGIPWDDSPCTMISDQDHEQ